MATPIKTLLLNGIKTSVQTVSDLKAVYLDPSRMPHENEPDTYTAIFTMPETALKIDLYRESEFDFSVETWVKADSDDLARERCIDLNSQIAKALLIRDSAARVYAVSLEEANGQAMDVLFYDGFCIAINLYHVKYRYLYGNPYQLNP
jgi:hypothetical protein